MDRYYVTESHRGRQAGPMLCRGQQFWLFTRFCTRQCDLHELLPSCFPLLLPLYPPLRFRCSLLGLSHPGRVPGLPSDVSVSKQTQKAQKLVCRKIEKFSFSSYFLIKYYLWKNQNYFEKRKKKLKNERISDETWPNLSCFTIWNIRVHLVTNVGGQGEIACCNLCKRRKTMLHLLYKLQVSNFMSQMSYR